MPHPIVALLLASATLAPVSAFASLPALRSVTRASHTTISEHDVWQHTVDAGLQATRATSLVSAACGTCAFAAQFLVEVECSLIKQTRIFTKTLKRKKKIGRVKGRQMKRVPPPNQA
jgi:hypothetical protein